MNAYVHSQLSVKHFKGKIEDYYAIHDFMDCSKELEATNLHRIYFHNMWAVKNIIIPIFGHTIINSDNLTVNVKDLCEQDHILPDYKNKFIPSLLDFVELIKDNKSDIDLITNFDKENADFYQKYPQIRELMLSPLAITGKIKSLLLTHNSWFLNFVLPKIYKNIEIQIKDFDVSPSVLFNRMQWADWVNNGISSPPSHAKIVEHRKNKILKVSPPDMILDGSRMGKFDDLVLD